MSGKPPGPWDRVEDQFDINDGTMCRQPSPVPGSLCRIRRAPDASPPKLTVRPLPAEVSKAAKGGANVLQKRARVVAADTFYILSHAVVQIRATNPRYVAVKNAPQYVTCYIEFGPAGGFLESVLNAVLVLAGVAIKGEVRIETTYALPEWARFGYGYEGLLDQRAALELDPAKGETALGSYQIC